MPNLGGWEFVILIGILVLLFGAKRLPDMARSIGQSARVFRGEMRGMKNDDGTKADKSADEPAAAPQALPEPQPRAAAQDKVADPARAAQPGSSGSSTAQ
jgi:sec-independent protein translocase protein TatA